MSVQLCDVIFYCVQVTLPNSLKMECPDNIGCREPGSLLLALFRGYYRWRPRKRDGEGEEERDALVILLY